MSLRKHSLGFFPSEQVATVADSEFDVPEALMRNALGRKPNGGRTEGSTSAMAWGNTTTEGHRGIPAPHGYVLPGFAAAAHVAVVV